MKYNDAFQAFRQHTEPDPQALERARDAFSRRSHRRFPIAAAIAAATVLLAIGAWMSRPTAPAPLQGVLAAEQTTTVALSPLITADLRGHGVIDGDAMAPRIDWTDGRLRLDVAPKRGIDLQVRTQEALVQVVG
ncbi:MAG: hypothetical protein AAFV53_43155, partial [Myxococcota bacterium]